VDQDRLKALRRIAGPVAEAKGVAFTACRPSGVETSRKFDYVVLCPPHPPLVGGSIDMAAKGGTINVFAGIPVNESVEMDLNKYIAKELYFIGTSGSNIGDMKRMLSTLRDDSIDTNVSVVAVSGLGGVAAGMKAIEERGLPGKIVVYPACRQHGLVPLADMKSRVPAVGGLLGRPPEALWNAAAENKLLELWAGG
jgi:threonine dehydrogenase-like Zn-dependent dehydrogenase